MNFRFPMRPISTGLTPASPRSTADHTDDGLVGEPVVRRADVLPLVVYVTFAMVLGWQLGQDANWDVRNYHLYNAFMWLAGRFERDVHVAGVQTFLNPVLDLPFYFAVTKFNVAPIAYGLALSAIHGVVLFFVHRITALVLASHGWMWAALGGTIAAMTTARGAAFYSEIGSTLGDNTVAVLVLGALTLLVANAQAGRAGIMRASRRAGLAAGLAAGAKLVAGIYVFGLLVAVLAMPGSWRARVQRALHFGLTASLGLVLTGGYWMWLMYDNFGSPLFPFFNRIFASPLAPLENFSDAFRPASWEAAIALPFHFVAEQLLSAETYFRDGRLPAALVSLAAIGLVGGKRWLSASGSTPSAETVRRRQLACFFAVSYVVWLAVFGLYRYATSLEALSAAIIVSCAVYLARNCVEGLLIALPICLLLIFSSKPLAYERIPWTDSFFGVSRDHLTQYHDAVVLLTDFPTAYSTPFFPHSTTFLRISSNWGLDPGNEMWRRVQQRVAYAPADRLYWLEIAPYATQEEADGLLAPFDVTLRQSACDEMKTNFDSLRICQIDRRRSD